MKVFIILLFILISCGDNAHFLDNDEYANSLNLVNKNFTALNQPINLPANLGTCSPNGASIVLSASPSSSMSPPKASCTCRRGLVDCSDAPEGPFNILSLDFNFTGFLTDNNGNSTNSSSVANIIPDVKISNLPDVNLINLTNYSFSGTCSENGQNVSVTIGSITPLPEPICNSGVWSVNGLDLTAQGEGPLTAIANHMDLDGDSATQSTDSLIKDTIIPTISITTPATDINFNNSSAYSISGTCSDNGEVVIVSIGGIIPSYQTTCNGGAWILAGVNVSALSDGAVSIFADHDDTVGNSSVQASTNIIKDTTLPTVAIDTPVTDIGTSNVTNFSVSGTCSENGETVLILVGTVAPAPQPTCSSGTWNITGLDVSASVDGAIIITADHNDSYGNSSVQASTSIIKDTIIPTVTITTPGANINSNNNTSYSVSGTCSENGQSVIVSVGGISPVPQPICNSGAWSLVGLNVISLSDGRVTITANHNDILGNSAVQATSNVTKDATLPIVLLSLTPNINSSNENNYTVSGTCSENSRVVTVVLTDPSANTISPSVQPICTSGSWSILSTDNFNVSSLVGGAITITADHDDSAGNLAIQASTIVLKDSLIPTVSITIPATEISLLNLTNYSVGGTCSENGEAVTVSIGGITPAPQPTCSAGAWSVSGVDVSSLIDGAVIITADHDDTLGNSAVQGSTNVTKDSTIPTVTITTPATDITVSNVTSYAVSGTCSENSETVTILVGTIAPSPQPTCVAGAWSVSGLDVSTLLDGAVTITADHDDSFGNSAVQASTSVTKDTALPTVGITTPATAISLSNHTSYSVDGTCSEDGETVTVLVGGIAPATQPTCTTGVWSVVGLDKSSLSEGSVLITADHDDTLGNSATQATTSVVKDTVIPTVAITLPAADISLSNESNYSVSGTCSENGEVVTVLVGSVAPAPQPTCVAGAWSVTGLDVSSLSDAAVMITADHDDALGNSALQSTANITKDSTIPLVAITTPAADITVANESSYSVDGTCSEDGETVTVLVGGIAPATQPTCTAGVWSVVGLDVSSLSEGSVVITADHDDALGNSAVQASTNIIKDTTLPTVGITTPAADISLSNETSYSVGGTCSENGEAVTVSIGGITPAPQPTCSAGAWSVSGVNLGSLSEGSITITADHDDTLGNSAVQGSTNVTKDSIIPTVTITIPASDINLSNETNYSVSGTCSENGETVTVLVETIAPPTQPTCGSGVWSISGLDVSLLSDGAVSITADHDDSFGNSAVQALTNITKDSTVPTVAISTPAADITTSNQTSYSVNGTCSENGEVVTVLVGGIAPATQPTCSSASWSITGLDISSLSEGSVVITADHDDIFGNSAVQASTSVTKDTTAPLEITNPTLASSWITGTLPINSPIFSWTNPVADFSLAEVALGTTSLGTNVVNWTTSTNTNDHTFINLSGLTECIPYYPSARTVDAFGNTSTGISHSTGFRWDDTDPTVPTMSSTDPDTTASTSPTTYWTGGSDNCNLDHFEIAVSTTNSEAGIISSWQDVALNTSGVVTGLSLSSGNTYYTIIKAIDAAGLVSSIDSISWVYVTPPDAITDLAISAEGIDHIEVAWTEPNDNGSAITDYIVEYRLNPAGSWVVFPDGVSTDRHADVTGLTAETVYDFRVKAVNGSGATNSNVATGETLVDDPFFEGFKAFNLGGAIDSVVAAIYDGTEIKLNGTVIANLDGGETHQFVSAQNDIIEGSQEIFVAGRAGTTGSGVGSGNVVWNVKDWAGKDFLIDFSRYTPASVTVRAFETALVEIYKDGALHTSQTVNAGTNHTFSLTAYDVYELISDKTIIVYKTSASWVDSLPILPSRKDVLGVPSGRAYFQVGIAPTNQTHWFSDDNAGTSGTFTNTALNLLGATGTQYTGEPLRVIADDPIGGHSYADGDGGQASPFIPRALMRKNYVVNVISEWVKFVSDKPATVTRTEPDGTTSTFTLSRTGSAPEAPYHHRLTNVLGGTTFEADDRMGVWYEPDTAVGAGKEDETILFGWD